MSSTALYKAFIDAGVSEEKATLAAEDVVQVSQLSQLATKSDISVLEARVDNLELSTKAEIAVLRTDMANLETRLIKWIVGSGLLYTGIIIAGISLLS